MRNARLDGEDLVYDCDGTNCGTPGSPHRINRNAFMASLEATCREFLFYSDPRSEDVCLALQFMWQTLFPATAGGERAPIDSPWAAELAKKLDVLAEHYSHNMKAPASTAIN